MNPNYNKPRAHETIVDQNCPYHTGLAVPRQRRPQKWRAGNVAQPEERYRQKMRRGSPEQTQRNYAVAQRE